MATFTGADKAIGFLFDMVSNIADDYDSSATYAQGAYTIHAGILYKSTIAIVTPEDFTPAHWSAVLVMDEVAAGGGGGSSTLAGLSDVSINTPTDGQVLTYDALQAKWKNGAGGGGSSGHTWSRTEHIVGTWVDGKTIYEKTIQYAFDNSSGQRTILIPHGVSNMQTVVAFFGIMNHSEVIPYGETFPSKDSFFGRCSVKQTNIDVSVNGSWYGYVLELTIQYTKSV